jgi:hypothetical protein
MAKTGRPTKYSAEIADTLCELIAEGNSASAACKHVGIPMKTMYAWLREHDDFRNNYARARDDQADTFADQMCDIAEFDEDVQRAKLKIDARKWVASRMKPKKWGDRQQLEHTGADGAPLSIRVEYDD